MGLWQRSFAGDSAIVGQDLPLEDLNPLRAPSAGSGRELYTVVGIMPAEFQVPVSFGRPATLAEMWIPFVPEEAMPKPFTSALHVVARLRDGVSVDEARAEAKAVHANIQRRFPDYSGRDVAVVPLHEDMVGDVRSIVWLLAATALFVVLIVLANLGNLFVTRGLARSGELALRRALGASRARLSRLLLTESMLLCAMSGALGAAVAWMSLPVVMRVMPGIPRLQNARIDVAPLATATAVALIAALVFTCVSILASRGSGSGSLNRAGRSTARAGRRLQDASIFVQTSVAALLLVATGLSLQSLRNLYAVDPGFEAAPRLTFQLRLPQSRYPDGASKIRALTEMHREIEALPGVIASGSSDQIPPDRGGSGGEYVSTMRREAIHVALRTVTQRYLDALGLEVIEGRSFRESDDGRSEDVILLSESAARALCPRRLACRSNGVARGSVAWQRVAEDGRRCRPRPADVESRWRTVSGDLPASRAGSVGSAQVCRPHARRCPESLGRGP